MFELVWILHIYTDNSKMADRNLSKFLDRNCDVSPAPNVKFVFRDEQGLVTQVDAHKMILAFASDGGKKRRRLISAHADGGPRSRVCIH